MAIWSNEITELDRLYASFKGNLPDIVREMEQLLKTDDPIVVLLYSRRCLEVIITDLCETELNRPRKTEPLKGIIDKLNSEEKVPGHIITSMISLNSMSNYGAHPKDFDPEQVKPVLNNLAIIIRWYLKHKDFKIVSKVEPKESAEERSVRSEPDQEKIVVRTTTNPLYGLILRWTGIVILILLGAGVVIPEIIRYGIEKSRANDPVYDPDKTYFTDQRDNEVYSEVTIGNQTWMGENLRAVTLNDGTPIHLEKDDKLWETQTTPSYCWYENNRKKYGGTYGALYNWYAVNTGILCPVGWHVPSIDEWIELINFVGDSVDYGENDDYVETGDDMIHLLKFAGKKLKEVGIDHWSYCDTIYSTDNYGFRALPGGNRNVYGPFWGIGEEGCFWSSTESEWNKGNACNVEVHYNNSGVTGLQHYKQFGMSVRCIKDKPPGNQ